jgi:hypothetical protein
MSDWEVVRRNKKPKEAESESEWEVSTPRMAAAEKESKGFKGIASDSFNKAIEAAMNIPSALINLPEEVYGAGKQALTEPKRALQNIGGGFGELGHGVLSAPGDIRDYLAKKDIVSQNAPSFRLPESVLPKDYNYAEALGAQGEQPGDTLLRGLPAGAAIAPFASAIASRIPGITNKAIAKRLSADKAAAIQEAGEGYNQFFNKAKNYGVEGIERPSIHAGDIVKNTISDHHDALKKFLDNPTLENAHWAQSDLGFAERHLKKIHDTTGLSSGKLATLKNIKEARNRIKEAMFKEKNMQKNPEFEQHYNQLSDDYLEKVVPYKSLEDLSQFENKKLKASNLVKSLSNKSNDEFMIAMGKKYPQIYLNKAFTNKIAKRLGLGVATGLGIGEGYHLSR